METNTIIVLCVLAFFIVGLLLNKWPFGLTAMTCCLILAATKVLSVGKAFAGFSNKTLILIASMYVLSAAFGKTSLLAKLQGKLFELQGKKSTALLLGILGMLVLFSCFLPSSVTVTLMIVFLTSLGNDGEISASRMIIISTGIGAFWGGLLPIGMGLTGYASRNAYYEALTTSPSQLLTVLDPFKFAIIPGLLVLIWCFLGYRIMPKSANFDSSKGKQQKQKEAIPKKQEMLINIAFFGTMIGLLFASKLGDFLYILPGFAVLFLAFTKAMTSKEILSAMCTDITFMIAGILVISDAMSVTGVGELVGNGILKVLGSNPNPYFAVFVFGLTAVCMTSVMSNIASAAVLTPLAASTAIAAGWNPIPFVLIVGRMAVCAILLPSASSATAMAHGASGYKLSDSLKFTVPFVILALAGCMVSTFLFFRPL